jgi:MYXO-CTERM domain-containing protein
MKSKLIAVVLFCGLSSVSNAANYLISNVGDGITDTLYADKDNTILPGGIVTLGLFASGFDVVANKNDIALLLTNFNTIFASGAIGGASVTLGRAYAGYTEYEQVDGSQLLTGNTQIGRVLYSFVGNGETLATSTQYALLDMGAFQNEDGGELNYGSNPPNALSTVLGTYGTKTGDLGGQGNGSYKTLKLALSVPEPSAALLGALGVLGLLRRRRN